MFQVYYALKKFYLLGELFSLHQWFCKTPSSGRLRENKLKMWTFSKLAFWKQFLIFYHIFSKQPTQKFVFCQKLKLRNMVFDKISTFFSLFPRSLPLSALSRVWSESWAVKTLLPGQSEGGLHRICNSMIQATWYITVLANYLFICHTTKNFPLSIIQTKKASVQSSKRWPTICSDKPVCADMSQSPNRRPWSLVRCYESVHCSGWTGNP